MQAINHRIPPPQPLPTLPRPASTRWQAQRAFTLIETMVVLIIMAILATVAAPGLTRFQRNAELVSVANTLIASINAARFEAMKRGRYTQMAPIDLLSWEDGWHVYVALAATSRYAPSTDIPIQTTPALPSYIRVSSATGTASSARPYIRFDPSGFPISSTGGFSNVSLTLTLNDSNTGAALESRRLMVAMSGRVRLCNTTDPNC